MSAKVHGFSSFIFFFLLSLNQAEKVYMLVELSHSAIHVWVKWVNVAFLRTLREAA